MKETADEWPYIPKYIKYTYLIDPWMENVSKKANFKILLSLVDSKK